MNRTQNHNQNRTGRVNTNQYKNGGQRSTVSPRMSRDELRRAQAQARRRKKQRQKRLFYSVLLLIAIVVGVILSLTVFFHIDEIKVEGESIYSSADIIKVSKIEINENLFMVNSKSASKNIERTLPYIEEATISRKLPATIVINVKATNGAYAVLGDSGYIIIDKNGKVLGKDVQELPENVAEVVGAEIEEAKVGEYASFKNENSFELLNKLAQGIQMAKLNGITVIDITDDLQITMLYKNRIRLEFGSIAKYEKKVKMAAKAIEDQDSINPGQMGVLNLKNDSGVVFNQENIFEEETTEQVTEIVAENATKIEEESVTEKN